jgi:hypothetical protein
VETTGTSNVGLMAMQGELIDAALRLGGDAFAVPREYRLDGSAPFLTQARVASSDASRTLDG